MTFMTSVVQISALKTKPYKYMFVDETVSILHNFPYWNYVGFKSFTWCVSEKFRQLNSFEQFLWTGVWVKIEAKD